MRFVIFVIDTQTNTAGGNEMVAIDAFNDQLQANGNWITAAGISAPGNAKLIDNRGDKAEVVNGSLFQEENFYSGFWLVEAESMQDAEQLAMQGSKACNRQVELRPYLGQ